MPDPRENTVPDAPSVALLEHEVRMVDMDLIERDPKQPRKNPQEPESLGILKASIRQVNIIEPITVRPHPAKPGRFMIVVGERRWCAAAGLGAKRIPAIVRTDLNDEGAFKLQLAENFKGCKTGYTNEELADAIERMMTDMKMDQTAVANYLGMSQPWVVQVLALKNLHPNVAAFRAANPEITRDKTALVNLDKLYKTDEAAAGKVMAKAIESKKLLRDEVAGVWKAAKEANAPPGKQKEKEKEKPKDTKQLDRMLGPDEAHAGDMAFNADMVAGSLGQAGGGGAPDVLENKVDGTPPQIRPERVSQKKVRQVVQLLGLRENLPLEELLDLLMDEVVQTRAVASVPAGAVQAQRLAPQVAAN